MRTETTVEKLLSTKPADREAVETKLRRYFGDCQIYWLEQGFYDLAYHYQKYNEISKQELEDYLENTQMRLALREAKELEHYNTSMAKAVDDWDEQHKIEIEYREQMDSIAIRTKKENDIAEYLRGTKEIPADNLTFAFLRNDNTKGFEKVRRTKSDNYQDIPKLGNLRSPLAVYSIHEEEIEEYNLFRSYQDALCGAFDYVKDVEENELFSVMLDCGGVYVTEVPVFWCLERPKIYRTWIDTKATKSWNQPVVSYGNKVTDRFYFGNVRMPRKLFYEQSKINVADVLRYENSELRNAMLQCMPPGKLAEGLVAVLQNRTSIVEIEIETDLDEDVIKFIVQPNSVR